MALSEVEAPKKIALRIAAAAKAKKAIKTIILDMRSVCGFCDYFVIASGASLRQINAVAQGIQEDLDKSRTCAQVRDKDRIKPLSRVSRADESGWIVLDYISVVAHIFYKPMREFYSLERLWADAKKVSVPRKR